MCQPSVVNVNDYRRNGRPIGLDSELRVEWAIESRAAIPGRYGVSSVNVIAGLRAHDPPPDELGDPILPDHLLAILPHVSDADPFTVAAFSALFLAGQPYPDAPAACPTSHGAAAGRI